MARLEFLACRKKNALSSARPCLQSSKPPLGYPLSSTSGLWEGCLRDWRLWGGEVVFPSLRWCLRKNEGEKADRTAKPHRACFPSFPQALRSLGERASCPGQPERTRPGEDRAAGGAREASAQEQSGARVLRESGPAPGQEEKRRSCRAARESELHPGLCLPCSVYSASRLRTRARARSWAQLTAWHWAAPAGRTALTEAAQGDTEDRRHSTGGLRVTASRSFQRAGEFVLCG